MHRPPGSPPAPASDLLPSSPSPSSSSSSCSDPPRPRVPRPHGLRKPAMPRDRRRRRASSSRTHHIFHHRTPLPPGCPGRPTRLLLRWSGATCGAATTTSRETCAGGNSSPTRSSSFASTRKEKSTAPKVRTIRTVSGSFPVLFAPLHSTNDQRCSAQSPQQNQGPEPKPSGHPSSLKNVLFGHLKGGEM